MAVFDHAIREDLNKHALRKLAVLRPLKLTITNISPHHYEELDAVNNPEDAFAGTRKIPFSRDLYIEQDDFMETPPPKFFRLKPGGEVRLKYAYIIKCDEVVKDASGQRWWNSAAPPISTAKWAAPLPRAKSKARSTGSAPRTPSTPKSASTTDCLRSVRLRRRLHVEPQPAQPEVVTAKCRPSMVDANFAQRYQFERLGYFTLDPDSSIEPPTPASASCCSTARSP